MTYISASDIESWTLKEPRRAQENLPLLVWKLIRESCQHINDCHFPFDKAIHYNGYDGFLDTDDESQFVPKGKSVWEFGTDADSKGKFNGDYKKRTQNPNGIIMAETTFCFVTTRIWKHKQGIVEATVEKTAEKKWRGVRILDANSLQMWLEICPLSTIWFADIIGKSIEDTTVNSTLLQNELCEKKLLGSMWGLVAVDIIALAIDFTLIKLMLEIFRNEGIVAIGKWHLYMTMVVMVITSWLGAITYQLLIGKRPLNIYKQGLHLYVFKAKRCPRCGAKMDFSFDDEGAAICKCKNNGRDHCFKVDHTKL